MIPTRRPPLSFASLLPLRSFFAVFALAPAFYACSGDPTDSSATAQTSTPLTTSASTEDRAPYAAPYFQLGNDSVHVTYGFPDGFPVLTYQDELRNLSFRGDDIATASTPAGTIVSVTLERTIDDGSTSFSLLVPAVELRPGSAVPVETQAFTTIHRLCIGLGRPCQGQLDDYGVVALQGSAAIAGRTPVATQ